jgi:aminodeoxyfutalosine deaminase
VLCADICNTSLTFDLKTESRIRYFNLLEVFGIDPDKATKRLNEIDKVADSAAKFDLPFALTPHSVYSVSLTLLKLLKERGKNNPVTSIHFMETPGEKTFLENHSGPIFTSFEKSGLIPPCLETVENHSAAITKEITGSGNLILVHNTFIDRQTIALVKTRDDLFWCLCPNSNIYIENEIPPVTFLMEEDCEIVIGTDSLASNKKLSILDEIKTLQLNFPHLTIEELVRWATLNGARALVMDDTYGKIETGMKPGLLLLQNLDLINMKLLPESYVTRLI